MKSSEFRTEIKLKKGDYPMISYKSNILLIGSCFSDNIAEKLDFYKFKHRSNPFGVSYNPASIFHQIQRITENRLFEKGDLIRKGEFFNSYELHGSFDEKDDQKLLQNVNDIIQESHTFLLKATHFYITLGTAWVYESIDTKEIVNNCHKISSQNFHKRLLSFEETLKYCKGIISECKTINPDLQFIFTLSPVRHLKDGMAENMHSKSILRTAIGSLIKENKDISYFPSYEIMMDDLRDYRFYTNDMLHPNETAIQYIWDKIVDTHFAQSDITITQEIGKIQNALRHKSFSPQSETNKVFLRTALDKLKEIQEKYSDIDLKEEALLLEQRLSK